MQNLDNVIRFIESDQHIMSLLKAAGSLEQSDCWVAAGAIRNPIWAKLHGFEFRPELENDVDVIYFDYSDLSQATERTYETQLRSMVETVNWEVRNQARMHNRNIDSPYKNCAHAMEHWPETATAIGARLHIGKVELLAPYGVEDLINLIVRQTPKFIEKKDVYTARMREKGWNEKWPKLTFI